MKINLGLVATSLTAAAVKASTDPNAADMSAADEQTFFKEHASNNKLLNGALASIAELKAEMAAMKSEHAAEMTAMKSELTATKSETAAVKSETASMKSKDAEQDTIIASLKAHRHGVVPLNLRRRNQEMSMSMPATANIWYGGGDEEPEENFFSEWDNHKESCCDDVKELKGRVSKIEDEVGDLNQCVDYQESYSPDGESPPLPTCKIGLGKPYVAIDGEFRVTTSTYNEDEGRVNVNTKDFDVDAQDSVTVKAMKTVTVEAHDIDLKSKNNIEAHAGNDIQIKADMDVYITADESSGSVGDVKIAGENVNVDADKSVNMAAKEHVMVNADHEVTVMAGDTLTVKADEDVKIAGQEIRVDAEASVDVSAKEHVMVNADDDVKISGDNVDVNANDDVKIVGGDSVYVAANASITMTAGETVTVKADEDVKIAGQDIHVDAEASVDVSAKKNVMVNADHNVTVMAGDKVTVEAVYDVKIVGQDVHVNAHDDIILKSKNDIMAHAENNTVIKAESDVHITADANSGADGDVKISGENVHVAANDDVKIAGGDSVHVEAGDDVKIMANDDVIIDADANNNTEGNVIIEGVKYFPQKKEICWSDQTKEISLRLDPPPVYEDSLDWTPVDSPGNMYSTSDDEDLIGSFDFGKISVGNGPGDVVVDVVASTGSIYFAGNDYYFESNLTESLGNQSETFGTYDADPRWSYVEGALVALAVELEPVGGGLKELPVPQAKVTLRSFQDVYHDYTNDDYTDGVFYQSNQTSTHPAKFLFPDIEEGEYDVKVMVFLQAESELQSAYDSDSIKIASEIKVKLGPHFISAAVIDATHEQCGAIATVP